MSVHGPNNERAKPWRVAWRDGRQRTMRFATEDEAIAFDALPKAAKTALADGPAPATPVAPGEPLPSGVFGYETSAGERYRFSAAGTTRRGYRTPEEALKAKGRFEERHERGEVAIGRMQFAPTWERYLAYMQPRITPGSYENLERDGRLHILPFLGDRQLQAIDGAVIEAWMAQYTEDVLDGARAPKTVNNWRGHLSAFFNWCRKRPDVPVVFNPVEFVDKLDEDPIEISFLTLRQIPRYYECCSPVYRPLARFLIGTGARVSEAIGMRVSDLDLDHNAVRIYRQRGRKRGEITMVRTKGRGKFRRVAIGDELVKTLRDLLALRAEHGVDDGGWLFLVPPPKKGRHAGRGPVPPHRKTVNDWHEAALGRLNERRLPGEELVDVTLHGLRHTAAASWLATGSKLPFVQQQLGHSSPTMTDRYRHLELDVMRDGVAETERRIEEARLQAIAAEVDF